MNIIGVGNVLPREIGAESIKSEVPIDGVKEPESFDIKDFIKFRGLRSLTKATKMAIASICEAMNDAGNRYSQHSLERIGLFVGSTLNPADAAYHFMSDIYETSPEFVSPLKFSSSVLNNISGWASIVFGVKGLNSTVISGTSSGIDALKMAITYINNNVIDIAIVTAVEGNEESSLYHIGNNKHKVNSITGAITIIIEKSDDNFASINKIDSFQHYEKNRNKIILNIEKEVKSRKINNLIYGSVNSNDELISNFLEYSGISNDINILNVSGSIGTSNSLSGFLKLITSLALEGETMIIETNEVGNDSIMIINSRINEV